MTRSAEQAGIQAGDLSGMAAMNIAVNGFRDVSQENVDAAVSLVNGGTRYITDQEATFMAGALGITAQRVAQPFPSLPHVAYGTKYTAPAASIPGANDCAVAYHPIEGSRIGRLGWGTSLGVPLTFGVLVRPTFNWTSYVSVNNGATANRAYLKRIFAPADQDTFLPLWFEPDPAGSWLKDNGYGLALCFALAAGSSRQAAAETWLNGTTALAGADIANLTAVAGQSVTLSGLVMFPGIVPLSKETLPLIARHVPDEEWLSKRYFEIGKIDVLGTASGNLCGAIGPMVPKRSAPNLTYASTWSNGVTRGPVIRQVGLSSVQIYASGPGSVEESGNWTANARM